MDPRPYSELVRFNYKPWLTLKRQNLWSGGAISLEALGTTSTGDETDAWEQGQSPGCESQKKGMRH